jgi:PAS domain S-box-containing protein
MHRHPVAELDRRHLEGSDIDLDHLQEALRDSREWWQVIFEKAGMGILLGDPSANILATNRALQEMLGYSEAELRALGFEAITHPDDFTADLELFKELTEGKRDHYQLEKRYLRKDGSIMWGGLTVLFLKDDEGVPRFGIALLQDLSDRKRSEAAERRLETAAARQRHALELNDDVIQGLAVAKLALESNEREIALQALESTLVAARTIVGRLLSGNDVAGHAADRMFVRERPAGSGLSEGSDRETNQG